MMVPGPEKGIWVIKNLLLKTGEIKFRMNNSWDFNYGAGDSGGLAADGANIYVKEGTYDILLDLRNPARAKTLIQIKKQ